MKIAIDIMAGDHGPKENINGVIKYIKANKNTRLQMTEHNGHGHKG